MPRPPRGPDYAAIRHDMPFEAMLEMPGNLSCHARTAYYDASRRRCAPMQHGIL